MVIAGSPVLHGIRKKGLCHDVVVVVKVEVVVPLVVVAVDVGVVLLVVLALVVPALHSVQSPHARKEQSSCQELSPRATLLAHQPLQVNPILSWLCWRRLREGRALRRFPAVSMSAAGQNSSSLPRQYNDPRQNEINAKTCICMSDR